jgi:hypothetical protein
MEHPKEKPNRSNFIFRKKFLRESTSYIRSLLETIYKFNNKEMSHEFLAMSAQQYAKAVEASIWSPHIKLQPDQYKGLIMHKTNELCQALMKKLIPAGDFPRFLKETQKSVVQFQYSKTLTPILPKPRGEMVFPETINSQHNTQPFDFDAPPIGDATSMHDDQYF